MSQLNVNTIKNKLITAGPITPSLIVTGLPSTFVYISSSVGWEIN